MDRTLVEYVAKSLDENFDGSSNSYQIYYVFGLERCDVEPVIVDAIREKQIEPSIVGRHNTEENNIFSFVAWKSPGAGAYFSNHFPGCVVIESCSWDYSYCDIYMNGKKAVPNRDYTFDLEYEENLDYEDEDEKYFDVSFVISDMYGNRMESGSGMITKDELDSYIALSTSSVCGDWENNVSNEANDTEFQIDKRLENADRAILGETIFQETLSEISGSFEEMGCDLLDVLYDCKTKEQYDLVNRTVMAICGCSLERIAGMVETALENDDTLEK